jgi:hypothetical protein
MKTTFHFEVINKTFLKKADCFSMLCPARVALLRADGVL